MRWTARAADEVCAALDAAIEGQPEKSRGDLLHDLWSMGYVDKIVALWEKQAEAKEAVARAARAGK